MKRLVIVAVLLAACGAKPAQPAPAPSPPPPPAPAPSLIGVSAGIQPEAWLIGDWVSEDGKSHEHWLAAAGALYGVRFDEGGAFEASIIDDAGDGGALVRWTYANGEARGPTNVADDPKRTGDTTMIEAGITWHHAMGATAPALEDADRAFFAATRDRGPDGWADAYAPDGVNWGGGQIVKGHDAIKADIAGLLGKAKLVWEPIGSRMGPGGDRGFTIGTFTVEKDGKAIAKGSYQTVWTKQPDGSWKVATDAGRPEN